MTSLAAALRMLVGLFVEDGGLALAILVIVVVAWLVSALSPEVAARGGHRAAGWLVRFLAMSLKRCGHPPRVVCD